MSTAENASLIEQIGEAAGRVWHALQQDGPMSVTKLTKAVDGVPRDVVMQAIGWLAREDKVWLEETKRGRMISLR